MARNSQIEWTHHTFNPWWGCSKVSAACDNCYAELWAKRLGHQLWGRKSARRFFGPTHWREPLVWNEEAKVQGKRQRVFCASMADVFEKRAELNESRQQLWALIEKTPWLDWLLLTKRPQNIDVMVPWGDNWPVNAWIGTTVENQKSAEMRLPFLLKVPASVRFLSCEPLLSAIDLRPWFKKNNLCPIDWVIAGGESGPGARPMHPDWATSLLRQCQKAKVPFHFKQWGHWVPTELVEEHERLTSKIIHLPDERPVEMTRLTKKLAGRILEGSTWDGFPATKLAHA